MADNLGNLYSDKAQLEEAEQMYQRALTGREKILGPDHPSTLDTAYSLGLLYHYQGKLKEAEQIYQRTLTGREKAIALDHASTLDAANRLGSLYLCQGRLEEAEGVWRRALSGSDAALGKNHSLALSIFHNLGHLYKEQGKLYKEQGKLAEADEAAQRASLSVLLLPEKREVRQTSEGRVYFVDHNTNSLSWVMPASNYDCLSASDIGMALAALPPLTLDVTCDICQSICDALSSSDGFWTKEHHTVPALLGSAKSGCHWCSLILKRIGDLSELINHKLHPAVILKHPSKPVKIRLLQRDFRGCRIELSNFRENTDTVSFLPFFTDSDLNLLHRTKSTNTNSLETLSLIKSWIQDCSQSHSQCASQPPNQLPARLIKILKDDNGFILRLISTSRLATNVEYITLSYCWGPKPFVKLSTDNLEKFSEKIEFRALPATFQDAVNLARSLGKQYLWIDALCIIQDSEEDWRTESARMGEIYRDAFLNIAATASLDVSSGLFRCRNPLTVAPCAMKTNWQGWSAGKLLQFDPYVYSIAIDRSPVSRRAWCLQERLLAVRTVHFANRQVFWECSARTASEGCPSEYSQHHGVKDDLRDCMLFPLQEAKPQISEITRALNSAWDKIVEKYAQADLTRKSDKLIAISGIARRLFQLYENSELKYLAGHWSLGLCASLLWRANSIDRTLRGPRGPLVMQRRAPSWSWASVDFPLFTERFIDDGGTYLATITEASTTPVKDPFGEVKDGYICIQGLLCEATIKEKATELKDQMGDPFSDLVFDAAGQEFIIGDIKWDDWSHQAVHLNCEATVHLIGIHIADSIRGLILKPTGLQEGEFVRIGYFAVPSEYDGHSLLQAFKAKTVKRDCYKEFDCINTYSIKIW